MTRLSAAALAGSSALLAACAGTPDGAAQCAQPHTSVGAVQGSGPASPMSGRTVTVQGVVVGDFEGPAALRGFYLQDGDDGDAATSAGIFIFTGDRDAVDIGAVVRVTGTAGEVRDQTQIDADAIVACGTSTATPADVTLPLPDAAYLERFEGMLVRLPQRLFVTEHFQLGRYGEVVLSSGARLPQPTGVARPGAAALAVQAANDRNRIILDDASYMQNPAVITLARGGTPLGADNTLRGGDHVTGITGVLTQTSAAGTAGGIAYRVRPVQPGGSSGVSSGFIAANPRDGTPPDVGGTVRAASFNLLNYFNTFTGCTAGVGGAATDCRGADDDAEFERQWRKMVAAIVALDADIIGIIEIENDGYDAGSAIADLVAKLNDATSPGRYAFIDVDAATARRNALGTDAIRVGFLYRPARVTPAGRTAVLNTPAFVTAGDSQLRNRPSLAQAFVQPDGGRVVISINHLKSKGSACDAPDAGDGQGECSAVRTAAAQALAAWLAADPTGTGETDVLILGDLNAYSREDPVTALTAAGYTDLLATGDANGYSYVFNGQWGYLDHALASPSLLPKVTGAAAWHINADEPPVLDYNTNFKSAAQQGALFSAGPFRSSDHDPILVGLELTPRR